MAKRAHHWVLHTGVSRRLCATCGLLELRNDVSRRAAAKPCWGQIDPSNLA